MNSFCRTFVHTFKNNFASLRSDNSIRKISYRCVLNMSSLDNTIEDRGYEEAIKTLLELQSNAEVIAKIRQTRDKKKSLNIPNMKSYIVRSGLKLTDVDNLSVIHISGTKGKGSTCAFCERILHSQGHMTGLFTSPHLIEVRERIRLNGVPISKELFSKYFWKVYSRLRATQTEDVDEGGGMPAYFAFLTVLSLHVFMSERVDVAVVEVGIGGQYDSTNFFTRPVVCGVTSLGLDHTAILGNTIEEIAWNKAGIFKKDCPAITVPQELKALQVLKYRATEIQNPLYIAIPMSQDQLDKHQVTLGIAGAKQVENASLALQLCQFWHLRQNQSDLPSSRILDDTSTLDLPVLSVDTVSEVIRQALSSCVWPGRAQTVKREQVTYYLDGAHTLESIQVCASWFKQAADKEKRALCDKVVRVLIFNSTGDREVKTFFHVLKNCGFDAALFCTNILSSHEGLNRADQINRTVTPEFMLHRAEANKASWDSVVTASLCTGAEMSDSSGQRLDHNFNNSLDADVTDLASEARLMVQDSAGAQDLYTDPHCPGVVYSHPVLTDQTSEGKLKSFVIPSIMDALAWATQGRDSAVMRNGVSLLGSHIFVDDKTHIQILITGSLHLVGGVLGVITPDMNNCTNSSSYK